MSHSLQILYLHVLEHVGCGFHEVSEPCEFGGKVSEPRSECHGISCNIDGLEKSQSLTTEKAHFVVFFGGKPLTCHHVPNEVEEQRVVEIWYQRQSILVNFLQSKLRINC